MQDSQFLAVSEKNQGVAVEKPQVKPSRKAAYKQYLKSPEARINRFLDNLDEQRIKREANQARRFASRGMRRWARHALMGMFLLFFLCGCASFSVEQPAYRLTAETEQHQKIVEVSPDGSIHEIEIFQTERIYVPQGVI